MLTQIAVNYKSKNNFANAIKTIEFIKLVKEDFNKKFLKIA